MPAGPLARPRMVADAKKSAPVAARCQVRPSGDVQIPHGPSARCWAARTSVSPTWRTCSSVRFANVPAGSGTRSQVRPSGESQTIPVTLTPQHSPPTPTNPSRHAASSSRNWLPGPPKGTTDGGNHLITPTGRDGGTGDSELSFGADACVLGAEVPGDWTTAACGVAGPMLGDVFAGWLNATRTTRTPTSKSAPAARSPNGPPLLLDLRGRTIARLMSGTARSALARSSSSANALASRSTIGSPSRSSVPR